MAWNVLVVVFSVSVTYRSVISVREPTNNAEQTRQKGLSWFKSGRGDVRNLKDGSFNVGHLKYI